MHDVVKLPESFFERSAPQGNPLGGISRVVPVNVGATAPDDPAAAWFDAATVVSVLDTALSLLKG